MTSSLSPAGERLGVIPDRPCAVGERMDGIVVLVTRDDGESSGSALI